MRIVIDGSCWANRRGFGRFTRCLVNEMAQIGPHQYTLVVDAPSAADPETPPFPDLDLVTVPVTAAPAVAAGAASSRRVGDMLRMGMATSRRKGDVVFFPASYSYFPTLGSPVVVTIHDAIAERLPDLTLPTRAARAKWWAKQQLALRQARLIVTVSEASRRAIAAELSVPEDRVRVIREAPAPHFGRRAPEERRAHLERFGLRDRRYLLYVGGISPHKNVAVLVDALAMLDRAHDDVALVLVGDTSDDPFLSSAASVRDAIARSAVADRIVMTGFVSDEELVALYGGAVATALPSLGEGFALTAAESAACATPVVASPDEAIVELLGDAGIYAAATSPAEFAACFDRLLSDRRHRDDRACSVSKRVASSSWRTAAEQTVAALEEAAAGRG